MGEEGVSLSFCLMLPKLQQISVRLLTFHYNLEKLDRGTQSDLVVPVSWFSDIIFMQSSVPSEYIIFWALFYCLSPSLMFRSILIGFFSPCTPTSMHCPQAECQRGKKSPSVLRYSLLRAIFSFNKLGISGEKEKKIHIQ